MDNSSLGSMQAVPMKKKVVERRRGKERVGVGEGSTTEGEQPATPKQDGDVGCGHSNDWGSNECVTHRTTNGHTADDRTMDEEGSPTRK